MFCAGFTMFFPLCFPSKILIVYLLWPFFLQLHFMLIFTSLLRLILLFNFPWYFPEKSGTFCFVLRHISMDLFCLIFSVEIISFSHRFIPLIHAFIFPSCFIYYSVDFHLFNLFVKLSNSYSFIYSYLYIRIHSDIIIHLFIRILIGLALGLPFELFS